MPPKVWLNRPVVEDMQTLSICSKRCFYETNNHYRYQMLCHKPATKKTPVLNAAGQPTASAAPAENGDGEPADNTKEPTETPPPSATQTPPVDEENIELPFVPAES